MASYNKYEKARYRVEEKKKFYKHLQTFLSMGIFFFVLNMITSPFVWWWYWPMLGWGIGLMMHFFKAFDFPGEMMGSDWEEKQMEKEMRKLGGTGEYANPKMEEDYEEMELREVRKQKRKAWDDSDLV